MPTVIFSLSRLSQPIVSVLSFADLHLSSIGQSSWRGDGQNCRPFQYVCAHNRPIALDAEPNASGRLKWEALQAPRSSPAYENILRNIASNSGTLWPFSVTCGHSLSISPGRVIILQALMALLTLSAPVTPSG